MPWKRLFFLWGPVFFWCALIFTFSAIPDLSSGLAYDTPLRKAAHFLEYAILAVLFWRALSGGGPSDTRPLFWCTLIFSVLYAFTDEVHQGFVPGRTPAVLDWVIDSAGALT